MKIGEALNYICMCCEITCACIATKCCTDAQIGEPENQAISRDHNDRNSYSHPYLQSSTSTEKTPLIHQAGHLASAESAFDSRDCRNIA